MRFEGSIRTWNDERGFGFIAPTRGGDDVFVHVSAFRSRGVRPQLNQRVTFEVEPGTNGKKRACRVMAMQAAPAAGRSRNRNGQAQWGGASLFAAPAFFALYFVVAVAWKVPHWVGIGFLFLSAVCFLAYAADKFAARAGNWRTRESTLLLLGLLGGWPGGLLAQQWLRHKSVKPSFRNAFWLTVVVHTVTFVVLSAPGIGAWRLMY